METVALDRHQIRQALVAALPSDTSTHGEVPKKNWVFVPKSHMRALRLESSLVVGARGVGKTFWSQAIQSEEIRRLLGSSVSELASTEVHVGYGEKPNRVNYPSSDVFQDLLKKDFRPYHVWRGVLSRWAHAAMERKQSTDSWEQSIVWVRDNPEDFDRLLEELNQYFENTHRNGLIVFDALDRSGADWKTMDEIVKDLLRVVLYLKPYARLNGKVFLREDQYNNRSILGFPDASKLTATKIDLTWAFQDLHGLLWQYLCNAPEEHGKTLRQLYQQTINVAPQKVDEVWMVGLEAKREGGPQKQLFNALAGEWMGRDKRRGSTYLWTVGHLADSKNRTSPRSFLAAIRQAAEDAMERFSEHPLPLHYESIKKGVQAASIIRVDELAEDYPWVKALMTPLERLTVPCPTHSLIEYWQRNFQVPQDIIESHDVLPPEHLQEGWEGLVKDLETLGMVITMKDKRINMPDLYRVGFGLGRRGGVRPITKQND